MSNLGIEINKSILTKRADGRWIINNPFAQVGGALFVVKAKWCGYCRKLDAEIAKAFQTKRFRYFYLDEENNQDILSKLKVSGFPTLYYVDIGGVLVPYNGERDANTLMRIFK